MKKEDKLKLFNLIKAASDYATGYSDVSLSVAPQFEDDPETQERPETYIKEEPSLKLTQLMGSDTAKTSTISHIDQKIKECKRCQLSANRSRTVPGTGVENPFVLVIGEGPGEEEDRQGLPFVGPAGMLLDKMLSAIQLSRNTNCYIANIVKCRPPHNRTPLPEEADACRPFLDAQIAALKPKAILCAGTTAVKNLFHTTDGITKIHGKVLDYKGIPVVATYHPSALLRDPSNKRIAWDDLKIFRSELLKIDPSYENKQS